MAGMPCCFLVWLACLGSLSAVSSANGGRVVVAEAAGGMEVSGAELLCASIGSRLSTPVELRTFVSVCGLLECRPAWLSDGSLRTAGCGNGSEGLQEEVVPPTQPPPPPPSPQSSVAMATKRPSGQTSRLAFCSTLPERPCGEAPVFPSARLDEEEEEEETGQEEAHGAQGELRYVCQEGHVMAGGARSFSLACDPQCGQWQGAVKPCVPEHVAMQLDYNVEEAPPLVAVTDWAGQLETTQESQNPTPSGLGLLDPLSETHTTDREVSFLAASPEPEYGHLIDLSQEQIEDDKREMEGEEQAEQQEKGESRRPSHFSLSTNSVGIKMGSRGLSTRVWEDNRRVTVTEEMPLNVPWLRGQRLTSRTSQKEETLTDVVPTYESPPYPTPVDSQAYAVEDSTKTPTTQDARSGLVGFHITSTNAANRSPGPTDFSTYSANLASSSSPSQPHTTARHSGTVVSSESVGTRGATSAPTTEGGWPWVEMNPISGRPSQPFPWPSVEPAIEARTAQVGEIVRVSPSPPSCVGPLCTLGGQQQQHTLVVAAGAVVAVCALIALVVLGLWCLRKRQRSAECQLNGNGKGQAAQNESIELQRTV